METAQQHYDAVAGVYDARYTGHRGASYHRHIADHVAGHLPAGKLLLDVGCGTGLFAQRYTDDGGRAVGLDISREMIRRGRTRCPTSEFCVGTGTTLPFQDAAFDAIASLLAFSYVPDPAAMLRECYRVLKPGGKIAICTLSRTAITRLVPVAYRLMRSIGIDGVCVGDFDECYYTNAEIADLFRMAGFDEVSTSRCSVAHLSLATPIYDLIKAVEPIVETHVPRLAYNVCGVGTKPRISMRRAGVEPAAHTGDDATLVEEGEGERGRPGTGRSRRDVPPRPGCPPDLSAG